MPNATSATAPAPAAAPMISTGGADAAATEGSTVGVLLLYSSLDALGCSDALAETVDEPYRGSTAKYRTAESCRDERAGKMRERRRLFKWYYSMVGKPPSFHTQLGYSHKKQAQGCAKTNGGASTHSYAYS